jgi:hypothetical protein
VTVLAAALALVVLVVGAQIPAGAQPPVVEPARVPPGFYVTPSLTLSAEFDDNVFVSTTDQRADFITRFTPGIALGYRSEPFTLLVSSSIDAEIFADNTELSDPANRKRAGLELRYTPYRLLTLGLDVTYFETNTPADLVLTTGLQLGRTRATQLDVNPSATYRLTAIDTLRLSYNYTLDTIEGGLDNTTHRVRAGYSRQLTPVDTGLLGYRLTVFQVEAAPTTITNTPTIGWIRRLGPNTVLTLEGGPRFVDDGSLEPEAHGRIDHAFRFVKVALDYLRSEAVVVGRPGKVELEAVTGFAEVEPLRNLKLRFEPGYYRTFGGVDPTARVYGFLLSGSYPIERWLTAYLGYRFAYQDQAGDTLHHNVVTLSLGVNYPLRFAP